MEVVLLSGSNIGTKTRTAINYTEKEFKEKYPDINVTLIDLAEYDVQLSDGRHYQEYEGDTKYVAEKIMQADAIIVGTPIFQASIPGALKNVFDLLPENALLNKVSSIIVTAGSPKHYLIAEQHLKPILAYMKSHVSQTYVFIEGKDLYRNEIINDDVIFRIQRLVEDTVTFTETYTQIQKIKDEQYGF